MKATVTLFLLLLALTGFGMAQETLFYDDFGYADSQVVKNLNTLRPDGWRPFGG